ncbi:MAG: 50S ribosomal protein L27 [Patescibacteria group bacterium]|nr:50S ribosomal protein L27 [Patescibacteria group bacterium]MDD5164531.1 50S ribosomal protein L27 [Patescibacteria group bacterium]MDD5534727.1 50S ribosomal protein L27 [Patescibacteria group bacterium]
MSHKKAGGSTSLGRDSQGKRLGVKMSHGQKTKPGMIIVRQRGTKFHPGVGVRKGSDYTLYAIKEGTIYFSQKKSPDFTGKLRCKKIVSVK